MTTTTQQDDFKTSDYIILGLFALVATVVISFALSGATTYFLVAVFDYKNFKTDGSVEQLLYTILLPTLLVTSFLVALLHKSIIPYAIWLATIIILAAVIIFSKSNGISFEQYAYNDSIEQFEMKYLPSVNSVDNIPQHPDMVVFYTYKDNPLLSEKTRREYFDVLNKRATALYDVSRYKTVYNLGVAARYFIDKSDSDKFFMSYADIKDPELRSKLNELMITPLVKTSDYVAFHSAYRQQFMKDNSSLTAGKVNAVAQSDTRKERMTDLQNISSIIHFFNNNNVDSLLPVKTEFLSLISQPSVTVADVDIFRSKLTNVLKADPALYSLMAQL